MSGFLEEDILQLFSTLQLRYDICVTLDLSVVKFETVTPLPKSKMAASCNSANLHALE